jgi:4-diphosphocytidyl-2-C-methyl-D-erythritol kinase
LHVTVRGEPLGRPDPWPAPAKLNLFLHIVGRRADGYHRLQTVFRLVDLMDEIRFWRRPAGAIERVGDVPEVPEAEDLTLRAARLLARHARVTTARSVAPAGVGIELVKRIPSQAGLGGGSSDAATVLVALNALWHLNVRPETLAELGLALGADVPVFVGGRTAWAEGLGEVLTPIELPPAQYVVVRPDAAVRTAEVFQAPELTRDSPIITIRDFLRSGGRNDCEAVVRSRHPAVAEALDWLSTYTPARLTGTGACVFGEVADAAAARDVLARLPPRWQGYSVRGLDRSPLEARLALERAGEVRD